MLECLLGTEPPLRLGHQLLDQINGIFRNICPVLIKNKFSLSYTIDYFLVIISVKRRIANQHDIKDAAGGPEIARLVITPRKDIRGNIVWGADLCVHPLDSAMLSLVADLGQPKINGLDLHIVWILIN